LLIDTPDRRLTRRLAPEPVALRLAPHALAVAFIASEYGPEGAAEEPAALLAASTTQIVRDDRSRLSSIRQRPVPETTM